jgi:diadenosine tetraphosphate (Ap4A) HIT family hydrolase
MTDFVVDSVIASLTQTLADWPLSRVFVFNDSRYHWGLLVPRRAGVIEMCDLSASDQIQMMAEIVKLSNLIRTLPGVEKLNVGNLGNMVPQGDPAWPGPVWGHSPPVPWAGPAPLAAAVSNS